MLSELGMEIDMEIV